MNFVICAHPVPPPLLLECLDKFKMNNNHNKELEEMEVV
jgi:hypothetical protein